MSTSSEIHPNPHAPDPHSSASHGSRKTYLTGFGLSVLLTAVPFWLVMTGALGSNQATAFVIVGLAFVQIIVHMIYFLHMDTKSEGGWTIMALIFTVVLVAIALSGTLWVMFHLNDNMMPMSVDEMSKMP
jgi:cytochrome o ubiquinol oxidase operon protein cyoD